MHCVSSRCSSCCHVKLEAHLFDLCAPVFRISKRPHIDAATSTFFAAYASGCIRAPSRVEPNMDTKRGALCQLLHPHRRCHMAQAHSNAHRAEGGHKASSHYLCLRLRSVYTVEASCALDSMRHVRLARPHCAHCSGCMQPPKSAATATLLRVGVQNFLLQTGSDLDAELALLRYTRKHTETQHQQEQQQLQAHPHSGLGLGRRREPIKFPQQSNFKGHHKKRISCANYNR